MNPGSVMAFGAASLAAAASAHGAIIYIASSGNLEAQAFFNVSGTTLTVRLSNTSTSDVLAPSDVLTAVFFDVAGAPVTLTRSSATLAPGSSVHFGPDGGGNVGGEWGYNGALVGAPGGARYGISAVGFDPFGPGDLFPGPDLDPPATLNGLNYGILSVGDNLTTGNAAVTGSIPLIKHQVEFVLTGVPLGFDLEGALNNVSFQYGTDLTTDPNLPAVILPAPGALGMLSLGVWIGARRRR